MRICVNSQTPFVKFKLTAAELAKKYGKLTDPISIDQFTEGVDYDLSPGGVTAMVYPLVKRMASRGIVSKVVWVSLGVDYPKRVHVGDILVDHVDIPKVVLNEYTAFKENLWSEIHGLSAENITSRKYIGYARYNWANSAALLDYWKEVDVFYVQDFQLLLTGGLVGPPAPAVLRWHVPFAPEHLSPLTHRSVVKWIEGFDSIVVSTRRDLEGLVKSAYRGRAHQVYPFVDPEDWKRKPTPGAIEAFRHKMKLRQDETLILMVARMDRIKSHDVAIEALARLKSTGKYRLALAGNGSFSSSAKGGLGHGKAEIWRRELEKKASKLGVAKEVAFLGHVSDEELKAAYDVASVVILPSRLEGFGLTVVEGWMNRKPVVVSKGAGVSELVIDGSNGYLFAPGDSEGAAEAIRKAAGSGGDRLGENGFETAKQCHIDVAVEREKELLEEAISIYK